MRGRRPDALIWQPVSPAPQTGYAEVDALAMVRREAGFRLDVGGWVRPIGVA
jgi:hypothetical protein